METRTIKFVDKILDNVHGFIEFTEAEDEIMHLLLFRRLQSIKQLSLVNWVFPGSEHTRFIHSLGVMHIADKIAIQLGLSDKERKIVRLAGLLHDIGHYPLSHVCEFPYKKFMRQYSNENFCKEINTEIYNSIEDFKIKIETQFMKKATLGHHEEIGSLVIQEHRELRSIIEKECGESAIGIICDMITGNVERHDSDVQLLVQILHSELDADGIDYMLRDAVFAGTSFGSFEVDLLISCMMVGDYNDKKILCINPKGISAADQYLINKFLSYSQVVFNKHTLVLEWMAEQVVAWMQANNTYFPKKKELRETWISELRQDQDKGGFLDFNDNYFWSSVKSITENEAVDTFPKHIVKLCSMLLRHLELPFKDDSEYKLVSQDEDFIKNKLQEAEVFIKKGNIDDLVTTFSVRELTKHIPLKEYEAKLEPPKESEEKLADKEYQEFNENRKTNRLMDGICVLDGSDLHLLCDDHRSLMQQLCKTHLVVMRSYEFKID